MSDSAQNVLAHIDRPEEKRPDLVAYRASRRSAEAALRATRAALAKDMKR